MEQHVHTLENLFQQLGLDATQAAIDAFVAAHSLPANTKLEDAPFWSQSQRQLIKESREMDADWAAIVDELALLLRQ